MSSSNNYWFTMLSYWVNTRKRTGFTIPFIIGAEKLINPDVIIESNSVHKLLNEIRFSSIDSVIVLRYCENLREYILSINNPSNPIIGENIKNRQGNTTIVTAYDTRVLGNNFPEILNSLQLRYQNNILNNEFSRRDFTFTEFSPDDKMLISDIFE